MTSLSVRDLTKKYNKRTVFSGLDLEHTKGVLGISGANGSGKSTFIKCIAFLLRPTSGMVEWKVDGITLDPSGIRKHIGIAAPYINLYDELTGSENLRFLQQISDPHAGHERIDDLLALIGMTGFKDAAFGELSTGQQQRFRLAAALIRRPEILLLDEPGSNLDEDGRALVEQIVRQQTTTGGLVVLATNSAEELALADRVIPVGTGS